MRYHALSLNKPLMLTSGTPSSISLLQSPEQPLPRASLSPSLKLEQKADQYREDKQFEGLLGKILVYFHLTWSKRCPPLCLGWRRKMDVLWPLHSALRHCTWGERSAGPPQFCSQCPNGIRSKAVETTSESNRSSPSLIYAIILCRYDRLGGWIAARLPKTLAASRCRRFHDSRSSASA